MLIPAKSTAILVLGFNLAVVGACSDDVRQSDSKSEEMSRHPFRPWPQ